MDNPFTLSFGIKPVEYISRMVQTDNVVSGFTSEPPTTHVFMITGVRGSGKTVMLSDITDTMRDKGWYVIPLNPTTDMLKSLTSKLYALPEMESMLINAKVNLSLPGLGVTMEKGAPVTDYETAISAMLEILQLKNKKVLVTIDEVSNTLYLRQFVSSFQIFIREKLPLFMLMTGLYDNIYNLQNDASITFLYRAPKIEMGPLNLNMIVRSYQNTLDIDQTQAKKMAILTKGYPFAYQVLGYLMWNSTKVIEDVIDEFDQYLQEYVYEKLWSELSSKDKDIIICIAETGKMKVKEIRESLKISSPEFSVYRDRLRKKGLIDVSERGNVELALPRFANYVNSMFI